jgi:hypothetical protein
MRFLERGVRALVGEARQLCAALRDWRFALLLCAFAVLLLLAAQAPLHYAINVGQQDGPGSDLPLLDGFYPPEHDPHGDFRWTSARADIRLLGVGQRPLQLTLKVFPIGPEVAEHGPRAIEVWDDERLVEQLPVRPAGATYRLLLPPPPDASGDHLVELRSATFVPAGDQRSIGSPVDAVYVASLAGPALPAWRSTLGWLTAALLAWLALRRAGFGAQRVLVLLLPGVLLAALAALLDPPRFAFGAAPALIALSIGYLIVLLLDADANGLLLAGAALVVATAAAWVIIGAGDAGDDLAGAIPLNVLASTAVAFVLAGWLRPPVAALYRRLAPPIAPRAWRWLLLFAWLVFALRFGGKIYPASMPGDIGFHANRYDELVRGGVLQLSLNRGVSFPYPPALYLLLAPFSLPGLSQRVLLRLSGALLDALSPLLVYTIATRLYGQAQESGGQAGGLDAPLVAAALYSFSAAGFMTTWWNFSTHIFTQFAHLLLITALVLLWPTTTEDRGSRMEDRGWQLAHPRSSILAVLVVLQSLVYLGHFGFWINMSLLGTIGLAALLVAALRGRAPWAAFRLALAAFATAELLAALLFYSDFAGLFLAQIQTMAAGGLTGLAGREAVDRVVLWRTLWDAGFGVHFGFFPLPLALIGLLLLARPPTTNHRPPTKRARNTQHATRNTQHAIRNTQYATIVLMVGTFVIGGFFAVLPFVSGSTLSTRWLMFSAWAIAVGAAPSARLLWRYGRAGRLLTLVMGSYVVWITASMWLMALAWRVRPPEPF